MKDEEQRKIEDQIYSEAAQIKSDPSKRGVGIFPELGLCNRCGNLQSVETEHGIRGAHCFRQIVKLNGKQRIRQCSNFWDVHHLSIRTLMEMNPIFIDPNKEKIGF